MAGDASEELHRLAVEIGHLPRRGLIQVAKAVKLAAVQEAIRATGDGGLSMGHGKWHSGGASRKPRRLGAFDTIKGKPNGATCRVQGRPAGPWVWLNSGTQAHLIGTGRSKRYWGKGKRISSPEYAHPVLGPIVHPGATKKGSWDHVVSKAETHIIPDTFQRETMRVVLGR